MTTCRSNVILNLSNGRRGFLIDFRGLGEGSWQGLLHSITDNKFLDRRKKARTYPMVF